MHIGLIGGIGPAATEVYYRRLVRLHADAKRRLSLTIVHGDATELIANLEAGRAAEQAAIFASYIDQLRAGGCEAVAVTSMGGHFCIKDLAAISSLPLINAIPVLDAYFAGRGLSRVGVLGARAVMESRLYGVSSAEVVTVDPDEIDRVHACYVAIAVAGSATSEQRDYLHETGRKLCRDKGAEVIVLGGTDLSLAFGGENPGYPTVDSAIIHADAIARVAMDLESPR
ncbi:aspartate/glutamate racemase family protein [Caballeronia glathei]|jgi:aspartate racemase|uniref:Aspartate racemase n=1 Tax=Caballeronia glathei TaxID=60547 RepID=A0A069PXN9_9BURK|nr:MULTISPECIES: aspartate/glutamate racemase family protein [Burkholderiaceae]KDR44614.1 aspartate racemase [Caballeronia glathei]TCK42681.1 aspartate racemase [Paraburkholderia sp. BL8N3]